MKKENHEDREIRVFSLWLIISKIYIYVRLCACMYIYFFIYIDIYLITFFLTLEPY